MTSESHLKQLEEWHQKQIRASKSQVATGPSISQVRLELISHAIRIMSGIWLVLVIFLLKYFFST